MAESQAPAAPGRSDGRAEPNHGLRIFLIWIVLALVADLLIWFVWYPHMPPGRMSESAEHQQFDITVLGLAAAPVMIFVWTYFGYTLVNWRHRDGDDDDGPPIFGHTGLQATWIGATAVIVLAAFVFGTVELIVPAGAGAGEGPGAGLEAVRPQLPAGAGHRPAVAVHLPLPAVRRDGDHPAGAAGEPAGRVPRHLAGRDPQLLGLPARGESRREPGRGQRGLHHDRSSSAGSPSGAASSAGSGTGPCSTPAGW